MNDETFSGVPVTSSSTTAPANESGAATSTTSGSTNDRNWSTITAMTAAAASASTASIDRNADCWPAYWPRDLDADPARRRRRREDRPHVGHHRAERAAAHVRRHRDHLLLVLARVRAPATRPA